MAGMKTIQQIAAECRAEASELALKFLEERVAEKLKRKVRKYYRRRKKKGSLDPITITRKDYGRLVSRRGTVILQNMISQYGFLSTTEYALSTATTPSSLTVIVSFDLTDYYDDD